MGSVSQLQARAAASPADAPRYVRVTNPDHRGFIEFQFSIGDPSLYLEMTLPPLAFAEFCRDHGVRHLSAEQARRVDESEHVWRYGDDEEGNNDDD